MDNDDSDPVDAPLPATPAAFHDNSDPVDAPLPATPAAFDGDSDPVDAPLPAAPAAFDSLYVPDFVDPMTPTTLKARRSWRKETGSALC
jgi:hypothetical protein